jgi:protein-S-isoprenylcysteine O-methyltransferase Ste14
MAGSNRNADKGPAVHLPPPLLALASAAAGIGLQRIVPLPSALGDSLRIGGVILAAAALLLAAAGLSQFSRAGTTVRPDRAPTALLERGPYRFSRNPLYLSLAALQMGLGLAFENLWVALLSFVTAALLARFVIVREERYLTEKFGEPYRQYCRRVRRWL